MSTLKFANRAKNIKNEPKINEDLDQKSLLRKYERELKRLRAELEEKNKNVVDKRRLLEIDEQRKRAEADKMAAIRALETRSLEFMKEKEEKKKLEERIAMLTNQMIRGETGEGGTSNGSGRGYDSQFNEQMKIEYEGRLAEIEKERETIEEEKAQVDRYKQLLLKQRDIMIALTQRLNERDEQIMALQDELDAYDRHQKELEEKLDEKTAQLIHLQRVTLEHNSTSPISDEKLSNALGEWGGLGGVEGGAMRKDLMMEVAPVQGAVAVEKDDSSTVASSAEVGDLKQRVLELERELESRDRAEEDRSKVEDEREGAAEVSLAAMAGKNETLVKERKAIRTIMESKVKILVNSVAASAHAVLNESASNIESTQGQALAKDLSALKRLVHAAVTALANADDGAGNK